MKVVSLQYLLITLIAITFFLFGRISGKTIKKEAIKMSEDVIRRSILEAKAKPLIETLVEKSIIKLTHFHEPRIDKILEKVIPPFDQTNEEIEELAEAMQERMQDVSGQIDEAEKICAKILPDLIRLARLEAVKVNPEVEVMLVKSSLNDDKESDETATI